MILLQNNITITLFHYYDIPHLSAEVLLVDDWHRLINFERFHTEAAKAYMAKPLQFSEFLVFGQKHSPISKENGHLFPRPVCCLGNADQMVDVSVGTNKDT
jgi:hypothetical protein